MHDSPQFRPTRRRFLTLTLGACGALSLAVKGQSTLRACTRKSKALGTEIAMTVLHTDEHVAKAALDAAFAELDRVERVMSIYLPESQISRLNRDLALENPDPYFIEVLQLSARVSEESGGAFDITVQPLWPLYATREIPAPDVLQKVVERIDWRGVKIG